MLIRIVCLLTVLALVPKSDLVSAEWFADIYGGGAFTTQHNTESALLGFTVTAHDVKFDTSGIVGGRAGVWFDRVPWLGVGLDVFHFQPTIGGGQTLEITAPGLSATTTIQTINVSVMGVGFDVLRSACPYFKVKTFLRGVCNPTSQRARHCFGQELKIQQT